MSLDLLQAFGDPSHERINEFLGDLPDKTPNKLASTNDEEDFGDFEEAEIFSVPGNSGFENRNRLANLVVGSEGHENGLLVDVGHAKPPPSPSFQELNAPLKLAIPQEISHMELVDAKPEESTPVTAWPSYGRDRAKSMGKPLPLSPYIDEEWGDFEEEPHVGHVSDGKPAGALTESHVLPHEEKQKVNPLMEPVNSLETSGSQSSTIPEPARRLPTGPAPTNIPPPSVLLTAATAFFQSLPTVLREIVACTSTNLINSGPSTQEAQLEKLTSLIAMVNASARILAGRKLRQKRDTYLAQSMRIGPANAGKAGGMKLAGVDRMESRKEDQEAAEALRSWRQQAGSLKSQVARINVQQSEADLTVPDISDNMPIRVAKLGEGAVTALKCCFLCGLKRDERVAKLDVNVEDSFGEWWMDHWGHVECIQFWEKHRESLKQR
ncbi:MAG: hypothetical protein Q9220_001931 [cf. Caloplaca sp. 1 TL-2023]